MKKSSPIDWTIQIWCHLILLIFVFLTFRIIKDSFHGQPLFSYVTNMGLLTITTVLLGLYFDRSKEFTLKYLVFLGFGLAWTIFAIRFTFPVVSSVNWFQIIFKKRYEFSPSIGRLGDFLIHVLPLLVYYFILYLHGKTLKDYVNKHPLWIKLLMAYTPYLMICIWTIFYNPYSTYNVPDNTATRLILYVGIPVLLLLTSSRPIFLQHTPLQVRITYVVQAIGLFIGICLGIYIFGFGNLKDSVVSFTCTILLIYLLFRIIKGNTHPWLAVWFLPVFGLIVGQVVCRELYFIVTGESHQHFIEMTRPGLVNTSYFYSLYLVLTYIFIFSTTSTLLASEFPRDISYPSPVRNMVVEARKNCKTKSGRIAHECWHTFGGVFLIFVFMMMNFKGRYDLGISISLGGIQIPFASDAIFLLSFMIFGYAFPGIFYRRNVKKIADKS